MNSTNQSLFSFIEHSPTAFQAVETTAAILKKAGYAELQETAHWQLIPGGKYYTTRNSSSLIAFHLGNMLSRYSFTMASAHLDSPSYKIKPCSLIKTDCGYTKLNVEAYGGMIHSTWLDRPLSMAGRAIVCHGNQCFSRMVNIDKDLLMICNVAPHMNREINNGYKYNVQVDMTPLISLNCDSDDPVRDLLSEQLHEEKENILSYDLFLYNREPGRNWGLNDEFISAPRLDDLQCAYSALSGMLHGQPETTINVCALFDNEEVGSQTRQGAASTFLYDVLRRINFSLGFDDLRYQEAVAASFMVSADNAHAVHPNHPELADSSNRPLLNKGIVIKHNASQSYASDSVSASLFELVCRNAGVPFQFFANRSDIRGGSTLGNISAAKVSVPTVDIGLPQLAMHSSYETAGALDTEYAVRVFAALFSGRMEMTSPNEYCFRANNNTAPSPRAAAVEQPVQKDSENLYLQGKRMLEQSRYGTEERKAALDLLSESGSLGNSKAQGLYDFIMFIEKAIRNGELSPDADWQDQLIYLESAASCDDPEALRFVE